jgi:hypothetical protein
MNSRDLRSTILPGLFGLAAPFVWVQALGYWSALASESVFRWLWVSFHVKGSVAFLLNTALETTIFAVLFGLALRALSGTVWKRPITAFCAAFLLSFFASAMLGAVSDQPHLALLSVPMVAALLFGTAVVYATLSHRAVHHDA